MQEYKEVKVKSGQQAAQLCQQTKIFLKSKVVHLNTASEKALMASYLVSLCIAKSKKQHVVG